MQTKRVIPAASCRFQAQLFNLITIGALSISMTSLLVGKLFAGHKIGFLPFVLSLPPIMIWLGASIFVYAWIAHHPNPTVRHYNTWAGYRYYGTMGSLVVFGQPIYDLAKGFAGVMIVLGLAYAVIVPWAIWDIVKARRENWQDMVIDVEV